MKAVLDATVFFSEICIPADLYTTPLIVQELSDFKSRCRFELLQTQGLTVTGPGRESVERVVQASVRSGDAGVLSQADIEVLALASELGAVIYTDDFAIQNVAFELGVGSRPVHQRSAVKRRWKYRCSGCGRDFSAPGECRGCGAGIKRKLK
jgi:UPF0271 protein